MFVTCEIISQQALGRSSSTTCTYNMPVQALVDSGNVIDVPIDCCQCVSIAVLITSLLNVPISKARAAAAAPAAQSRTLADHRPGPHVIANLAKL